LEQRVKAIGSGLVGKEKGSLNRLPLAKKIIRELFLF